jgi:hypothetical protein
MPEMLFAAMHTHIFLTPQKMYFLTFQFLLRKGVNSKSYFPLPERISWRLLEVQN